MGSEGITGNKNLFFFNISIHCIRPVQVRYKEETECTVSDLHCHVVSCRNSGKVSVYDLFQESKGTACSDDFHTRVQIQKPLHTACMVRLGVLYNKIVNALHIGNFFEFFQIIIEKFLFCSFEEDGLVPCFQNVRIVCCSKFCVHDNVKYTQIGIYNSCPVKILP